MVIPNRILKIQIIVCILFLSVHAFGQHKGDYIWQLGQSSYVGYDSFPQSLVINFNHNQVEIDTFFRPMFMGYFNTSISNNEGELLLVSNGCQVRDADFNYITGTNHLSPGDVELDWCTGNAAFYPVFEGGLFFSFFNDSTILLLHQRLIIKGQPTRIYVDTLYYSEFELVNGKYLLKNKKIPIISGKIMEGNVEAIKTEDGKGWWVIQQEYVSNKYFIIKIEEGKIDTTFSQIIGDTTQKGDLTQSVFSPNGKQYARFGTKDQLYLFDFDRSSGLLSNFKKIHVADTGNYCGVAFSPNSRFLYVCNNIDVYQLDIESENIETSKVHLGHYDGYLDPFPTTFYLMQLGPDCRIYLGSTNGVKSMHVINEPDVKGIDCRFEQHAIHLPIDNTTITFPNFPNYRSESGPPCDPNISSGFEIWYFPPTKVDVYPNPVRDKMWLKLSSEWKNQENIVAEMFDQTGKIVLLQNVNNNFIPAVIDLTNLVPNVYFLQIRSDARWFVQIIIKQ